jgi:hypothetical protein
MVKLPSRVNAVAPDGPFEAAKAVPAALNGF